MFSWPNSATIPLAQEKITTTTRNKIENKNVSIENDRQSEEQFKNFLDPNLPICVIGCEGKVGTGKSTLMNLIALHLNNKIPKNELFVSADTTFSATPGCSVLYKKFIFNGVQIVLMDFEGQGGLRDSSRKMEDSEYEQYLNKLMCLSFVIPSVLIVVSHQRIEKTDINNLMYLESIHKKMADQKINIPNFKWFIKEGYKLKRQQLEEVKICMQEYCPNTLKDTTLIGIPYLDQGTLDFTKRQKFQEIEDLLIQATQNPQNLPNKQKLLKIFETTFSLINSNDFEVAYGYKLGFYRVWEEWDKTEGPKFEQAENQLALDCEKANDNGTFFESKYQSLVDQIEQDIIKRLAKEGISLSNVYHELKHEIKTKFNLERAKTTFLKTKQEKQVHQAEINEAEQQIKKLKTSYEEVQKNNNDLEQKNQELQKNQEEYCQKLIEIKENRKDKYLQYGFDILQKNIIPLLLNPKNFGQK